MKIKLQQLLVLAFSLNLFSADAQIYPYMENFDTMSSFTNPAGWTCTVPGFQVYPNHGTSGTNGMTKQMTTLGSAADSVISPFLGPVNSVSAFAFDYRIMETNLYPNFAHTLSAGEKIEFYAVSGPLSQLIATIDMTNHVTSTSWANIVFPMGAFAGNSGNIMIKVYRTTNDFFADFDNISLDDATGIAEEVKVNEQAMVFPNPSVNITELKIKGVASGKYSGELVSSNGTIDLSNAMVIDQNENNRIQVPHLAPGFYLLKLNGFRNNYQIKFVVKD